MKKNSTPVHNLLFFKVGFEDLKIIEFVNTKNFELRYEGIETQKFNDSIGKLTEDFLSLGYRVIFNKDSVRLEELNYKPAF